MASNIDKEGFQWGSKGCSNCAHRGPKGWESNGPCRTCTGYHGGYPNWKADPKTLAGYIEAIQKREDECHLGDSKLNVTSVPSTEYSIPTEYDIVSKPKHYMLFEDEGIEVRDVLEKLVDKMPTMYVTQNSMFVPDYVQMMQYLMRFMDKNGLQDLEKAQWYLTKLIESYPKQK